MNPWENWFQARSKQACHRQLIVLSGARQWTYELALSIATANRQKSLWLGSDSFFTVRGFTTKHYAKLLGRECDVAVYDAHDGLLPSAYLALSGTIRASGVMVVCCPPWQQWAETAAAIDTPRLSHGYTLHHSPFIRRWQTMIDRDPNVILIKETSPSVAVSAPILINEQQHRFTEPFASYDQSSSYAAVVSADRNQNFIVTARRGRGKSALLGLLADFYTTSGRNVVICSAHKNQTASAFALIATSKNVTWVAPDSTLFEDKVDLLLIDEVASLPIKQTLELLARCNQYIIATTTEGYEGTGRGFHTKLVPKLNQATHPPKQLKLHTPIRYACGDVLEAHNDKVFLLSDTQQLADSTELLQQPLTFAVHKRVEDIDESALTHWFSLLSHAHYQTTPEDAMRILDGPDNFVITVYSQRKLIAIAVICEEGGHRLSELASDIACGARRAKGHLFAQKLALLLSDDSVLQRKYWRINRIAVSQECRSSGVGSRLLNYIHEQAHLASIDTLCVSFGATLPTAKFWHNNGFQPVNLGNTPDKASGEISLQMLKHITPCHRYSYGSLINLFVGDNRTESAWELFALFGLTSDGFHPDNATLAVYQRRILDYVNETRSHLHIGGAAAFWLMSNERHIEHYAPLNESFALLKDKWLEGKTDLTLQRKYQLNGRKKLYLELRLAFQQCYWYCSQ